MTSNSGAVLADRPLCLLRSWLLPRVPSPLRNMLETLLTWQIVAPVTVLGVFLVYKYCRRWRRCWPFTFFMGCCFGKKVLPDKRRHTPTRHPPGYLGLRNEGSTCYLNSILQCLFMAPDFTNEILSRTEDSTTRHVDVFQNLFLKLQYGHSPPSTLELMRCFGIQEGRQQDVEEHFRLLINNLPKDIQQLFRIQMVHSLKCKRCENEELMQNPMLCLPLAIKDPEPSVGRALFEFHENNILDLDNQCYCSICKHKEDAVSRHYFTDLPQILVVHLKRYEIYEGRFKKISCPVSLPSLLTVSVEKPQEAAAKDKRQEVNRIDLEEAAQHQKYKDQDSVTYTLFALCNHYGGLRGGHYTAEIMSFDDYHWFTFNDTQVTAMRSRSNEKDIHSDTAYLLMYYQKRENHPKFREKEDLPSAIQRRIDETSMDSYTQYRMHFV